MLILNSQIRNYFKKDNSMPEDVFARVGSAGGQSLLQGILSLQITWASYVVLLSLDLYFLVGLSQCLPPLVVMKTQQTLKVPSPAPERMP